MGSSASDRALSAVDSDPHEQQPGQWPVGPTVLVAALVVYVVIGSALYEVLLLIL